MKSGAVTLADVREGYHALLDAGETPSTKNLLAWLGRGSLSTIQKFKRQIESEGGEIYGVGGAVHSQLLEVVMRVHDQLKGHADTQIARAAADFENAEIGLTAERDDLVSRLDTTTAELERVCGQLKMVTSMYEAKVDEQQKTEKEKERALLDLDHERERVKDLQQQVRKAEGDATHARIDRDRLESRMADEMESLRKANRTSIENANHDIRELNNKLNAATNQVAELKMRLSTAEADAASVHASLDEARASYTTLLGQSADKDKRIDELRDQKDLAQSRELESARELRAVHATLAQTQQELAVTNITLGHAHTEKASLTARLQEAQQTISRLESKPMQEK